MSPALLRRLPGFAFETRAPVLGDVLPRMDVALFAGFSASGPVGVPVPVEDPAHFAAVFGEDAPLAWDADLGRTVRAQLGPSVRSFFANGGRRCWIVRLARNAKGNALPVPGVLVVADDGALAPLELGARSPGSWSDGVALSASLTSRRFGVFEWDHETSSVELLGAADGSVVKGDLLRLTWPDARVQLYAAAAAVVAGDSRRPGPRRSRLRVTFADAQGTAAWFHMDARPAVLDGRAHLDGATAPARFVEPPSSPPASCEHVAIEIDLPQQRTPHAGEVIVAHFGLDGLFVTVEETTVVGSHGTPPLPVVRVRGPALRRRSETWSPAEFPLVERLALDLRARTAGGDALQITGLGLAPGHPRHIRRLPGDSSVYGTPERDLTEKWIDAVTPRFPAAGDGTAPLCIPFGVGALPKHELPARPPQGSALERDGLDRFDASLFLDEELEDSRTTTLLADAEYLRFMAPEPRELRGLHAAIAIEEATLFAVPDAVNPGWASVEKGEPLAPDQAEPTPEPCPKDDFIDCDSLLGPAPLLRADPRDAGAGVSLAWTAGESAGPFVVEEARDRDWRDASVVYRGPERGAELASRSLGDWYYRVRGVGAHPTAWSRGRPVRIAPGGGRRVLRPGEYRDDVLAAVHRTLLRICAARGDAMAVLSLPEHYREDDALAHVRLLGPQMKPVAAPVADLFVPEIGAGESSAPGYGALYHGWIVGRDEDDAVRAFAPDGAACGVLARRADERGAWVAPANEPLRGVIALERPAAESRWAELQTAQINVVRRTPRGFAVLCADTLAVDEDVRPINVRRLLILLRRLATRMGASYVFEPNDDSLRRMVQRGFETILGDLYQRGAFAGANASAAFQVVTGEDLNTPQSVDAGRFIVELRVAPSRPMAFLTLRLVRTGERIAVTGG